MRPLYALDPIFPKSSRWLSRFLLYAGDYSEQLLRAKRLSSWTVNTSSRISTPGPPLWRKATRRKRSNGLIPAQVFITNL